MVGTPDKEIFRWYATPALRLSEAGEYGLTLSELDWAEKGNVLVDKVLVVWGAPDPQFRATQADLPDSDDDGLMDGVEAASHDYYIEAEWYPIDSTYVISDTADSSDNSGLNASGQLGSAQ